MIYKAANIFLPDTYPIVIVPLNEMDQRINELEFIDGLEQAANQNGLKGFLAIVWDGANGIDFEWHHHSLDQQLRTYLWTLKMEKIISMADKEIEYGNA